MPSISLQSRLPKTYRIKEVKQETENVRLYTFDGSLGARPGQFIMLWVPGVDEVPLSVAYDDGAETKIAFFAVGDTTEALANMNVGDLVGMRGPFGTHYEWKPGQHLALVAGGYGAAPMFFVASESVHHGTTIDVIVGARGKEHLLFLDALESLPHVALHIATDDGSMGFKGYNVQMLDKMLEVTQNPKTEEKAIDQIFACGPERMLKAALDISNKYSVPCQLSMERYMKCGYGLCGNCVMDPLGVRMCVEGPVVKGEVLNQLPEFGKYHRDSVGRKHDF